MNKFIFHVAVGSLPPKEAIAYVAKVRKQVMEPSDGTSQPFFPSNRVVFISERGDSSFVETVVVDGD